MSETCNLCPRACNVHRNQGQLGVCKESNEIRIARAALHMWEEPCFSGTSGSGTIFFSGCNLHCIFCQNGEIANSGRGRVISVEELANEMLRLQDEEQANNINLVTGSHFVPQIVKALELAKNNGLKVPILYNTSSYDSVDAIKSLDGLVDLYLPDLKYLSNTLAKEYSHAEDYPEIAKAAIAEMVRQTGAPRFAVKGTSTSMNAEQYNDEADWFMEAGKEVLMVKGTVVRHLLLPGETEDTKAILRYLHKTYGNQIYISIMNQYTPMPAMKDHPKLSRKVEEKEYEKVIAYAIEMGIENAFIQEGDVAEESFIPEWD